MPDCIVLAGGLGSRLRDVLSEGTPKVLAPVAGKPFLWWLIRQLHQQEVRRVILALGYGAGMVRDSLASEVWPSDLVIHSVVEAMPLGTGGALRFAFDSTCSDPILLVNGDTLTDVDYGELIFCHTQNHATVTVALAEVPDASQYGLVEYSANGVVTGFREKEHGLICQGPINAGVYCLSRQWVASLPTDKTISLERELLPSILGQGFFACPSAQRFIDIGTPSSLCAAGEFVTQSVGFIHDH